MFGVWVDTISARQRLNFGYRLGPESAAKSSLFLRDVPALSSKPATDLRGFTRILILYFLDPCRSALIRGDLTLV